MTGAPGLAFLASASQAMEQHSQEVAPRRLIKRYSNRKLYDTEGSRYVTLLEIADMVRAGEEVQIIDNATKEDKTEVTLALIISEELKERPRGVPLSTLKALIRHRGERLLTTLRDGPIGRLMPREEADGPDAASTAADASVASQAAPLQAASSHAEFTGAAASLSGSVAAGDGAEKKSETLRPAGEAPSQPPSISALRRTLEQWQAAVDERIRAVLPASSDVEELKLQVRALNERLAKLEERAQREAPEATRQE